MDDLTTSIEKLKVLLNSGIITAAEFETKRQTIVDHFVGVPTAGAAPAAKPRAKPPAPAPAPAFTPKPQAAARPPSYGLALATNHAKGKGKGGKGKGAAVAVTPAPTAQPIRPRGAFTNPRFHPYAGGRGYTKPQPWPKDWHEIATIKVQPIPMGLTDQHLVEVCHRGVGQGEYISAPGMRRAKLSHALVWPLELGLRTPTLRCGHLSSLSHTRGGFFDFEVGGHDGA